MNNINQDIINNLIQDEWETVGRLNGIYSSGDESLTADLLSVVKDMVNDSYIHIGQLEKLLAVVDSKQRSIEDGRKEEDELPGGEDVEDIPSDDIPIDIADSITFKPKEKE